MSLPQGFLLIKRRAGPANGEIDAPVWWGEAPELRIHFRNVCNAP
jgi:hypothetical protein